LLTVNHATVTRKDLREFIKAKNIEKHMKKILENLPEIEEKIENMRKKVEGKAVVESYADFLIKEGK